MIPISRNNRFSTFYRYDIAEVRFHTVALENIPPVC